MVVMVDDRPESIKSIQMINGNESVEIDIPAILISNKDGEDLIRFLLEKKEIYAKIRFVEPAPNDIVEYQYWLSSMEKDSYRFLNQFRPF